MISLVLMEKIFSLFIILFLGALIVRLKLLKPEDSRVLSAIVLFVANPCAIISSFEVDLTPDVVKGFCLAFSAALVMHFIFILMTIPMKKVLHMDSVEILSVIYSNAGNLIIPLVTVIFGSEWVVYSCAYVSVQLFFLWSHAKSTICEEKGIDLKKILTNVNLIAVFAGIIIFLTGFRFAAPVQSALDSMGALLGPLAMLVTGMLIGAKEPKAVLAYKRLPLVVLLRLVIVPGVALLLMKLTGAADFVKDGETILLISLLATTTPAASTITQMSVVYGKDADYASAINVMTTLCCIITMPLMVSLYQML